MFKKGDRIIVGEKRAVDYNYTIVVGMEGTIRGPLQIHNRDAYYEVDLYRSNKGFPWCIQSVDCIPSVPKSNKEALRHLEEEY